MSYLGRVEQNWRDKEHHPNQLNPAVRCDLEAKIREVEAKSKHQCILLNSGGIIIA